MSKKIIKEFRSRQQVKDEQINYLLADVEKNLEEYKIALELKEKQLSDAKKILLSAKQSYDKTVAENRELKAYIENLKQHIQQQQVQFLEKQRNYYQEKKTTPRKYKKVVYQEETESEPEFEEEEQVESESEQIEKEPEIKKARSKKREAKSNIFDYINKNAKRNKR